MRTGGKQAAPLQAGAVGRQLLALGGVAGISAVAGSPVARQSGGGKRSVTRLRAPSRPDLPRDFAALIEDMRCVLGVKGADRLLFFVLLLCVFATFITLPSLPALLGVMRAVQFD